MKRIAKAHWSGTLKEGKGELTSDSGVLNNTNYSYKTRFEEGIIGTNPEELLAAAHAGCFTMAVAGVLTKKGYSSIELNTEAAVSLEDSKITGVHLSVKGSVPGMKAEEFAAITEDMSKNCIVGKALSINITSEAHFTT